MQEVKPEIETFAKIKVFGIGGGGGSALNRMIQHRIRGVEFVAINTDLQALQHSLADKKIHVGRTTTRGLGAGMNPEIGRKAAEESQNELREILKGSDMVFITYGLGGGTGTGSGPIIAELAKEQGALTIAVVTKPFSFEGAPRRQIADEGLENLKDKVDTLITIPNDRIWQIIDKKTPLLEAFSVVDEVLRQGVQGIAELITLPGLINVDFADVKTIMRETGAALMGVGQATGENRAIEAAKAAISSPLLELNIDGAKGILFNIVGGNDITMYEISEAAKVITESVDPDAKIIFGAVIDEELKDEMKITVVATGFDPSVAFQEKPRVTHSVSPVTKDYFQPETETTDPFPTEKPKTQEPVKQPSPPTQAPAQTEQPEQSVTDTESDDEDLEIPAFIRRKMM